MSTDNSCERGPFDMIGDVHGCFDELAELLGRLGYVSGAGTGHCHPDGRRAVFVGDLVNRGPATPDVLRLVMSMVASGDAKCVQGNHDLTLLEALKVRGAAPVAGGHERRGGGTVPRLGRISGTAGRRAPGVPPWGGQLPRRAGQPPGPRRGEIGRGPRRCARRAGGTAPPGTMVVFGHTPVETAALGERDDLHRHGLRLRGELVGLAVPRTGSGQRGRPSNLLGASPPSRRRSVI